MAAELQNDDGYTPEYGDTFLHRQTGDEKVVHDVRDDRVTFSDGGWEYVDDLEQAVEDIHWAYDPIRVGGQKWEDDPF